MSGRGPNNKFNRGRNGGNRNGGRGRGFNRNRKNTKGDTMPELAPAPLTYFAKPDKQTRIKIEWKIEGTKYQEKLPIYDDTAAEDYIRAVKEFFIVLGDDEKLKEDDNVRETAKFFRKMMKGEAKVTFSKKIEEMDNGLTDMNTLLSVLNETSKEILGQDAFDNQMEYLKKTKKPKKLIVDEWLKRIRNINGALPYIDMDEDKMSDKTLIRDVILPNIPPAVKYDLRSFGGDELTWTRMRSILSNIFTNLNVESNNRKNNNKGGRFGRNNFNRNTYRNDNGTDGNNSSKGGKNDNRNESYKTNKNKSKKKSGLQRRKRIRQLFQ